MRKPSPNAPKEQIRRKETLLRQTTELYFQCVKHISYLNGFFVYVARTCAWHVLGHDLAVRARDTDYDFINAANLCIAEREPLTLSQ